MRNPQVFSEEKIPTFDELLNDLSDEEVEQLSQFTEKSEYVPGETIFYENEAGDALYIIQNGAVEICKMSNQKGREYVPLITLKEGNVFGEMSFLLETTSWAAAVAAAYTTIFKITRLQFEHIVEEYPALGCKIYNALCQILAYRLRRADEKAKELAELKHELNQQTL
ncbi:MAG: cyclic nucleotide-binding domain-containing protein [bacterium]